MPSSLIATTTPKESCASPLDGLMYACCAHVVPVRVKTYAAPDPFARLSVGAVDRARRSVFVERAHRERVAVGAVSATA